MTADFELAQRKQSLRRETRARLNAFLRPDLKNKWDEKISEFIMQILPGQGGLVAGFVSLTDEPTFADHLLAFKNWTWCWPRVEASGLQFYSVTSSRDFLLGAMGLQEPDPKKATPADLQDCDVVCLPGVAFDHAGRRLGRGKGYYDQALAQYKGTKVGVAYSAQMVSEDLPDEPHDVRMNYLVNEKFILKLKGQ